MIKEACVENFTDVPSVIAKGAGRIELCDNLAEGGTTVSYGVMSKTISFCRPIDIPVMVIIRPRGGNFVYTNDEKEIMLSDIKLAIELGVNGLVIGALTLKNELDLPFLEQVISTVGTKDIELTFHMAFDQLSQIQQLAALITLSDLGFSRILTHGSPNKQQSIIENVPHLNRLMLHAPASLQILPGGGVTRDNLTQLEEYLPLKEAHGTNIV